MQGVKQLLPVLVLGAELLLPGKLAVIPGGIADLTAAGHHEPDLLRFGKLRLQQPVPHHSRKPPPIGWRYHNELAACGYRSRIVCFNAVVYAEKRLMQRFRDAPGHIPAVAGACKIEYHVFLLIRRPAGVTAVRRRGPVRTGRTPRRYSPPAAGDPDRRGRSRPVSRGG